MSTEPEGAFVPSVSIIINTDGRMNSLATTLESLRHLHYRNFEVIVVHGPTLDGTLELLEQWRGRVKIGSCKHRNLSESRNISLAMAAGEIVAFLDDDSIPEPEWLDKVTRPFVDASVAAAGGYLFDHTGVTYQWKWGTADRKGTANENWTGPAPEYNFPYSANIPHVMANSAFRLSALMSIGGFDENYVYFLDETDAICRLVDTGWKIIQLEGAPVHHKFLASHLRNDARVLTSWYQIIRSKLYFALVNAQGHHGVNEAIDAARGFADALRGGMEWHIQEGRLDATYRDLFASEYERAMQDGLASGLQGVRDLMDPVALAGWGSPFLLFPAIIPDGERRCICLLTRWYPPGTVGGIGRYVQQLAQTLAGLGHQVRVLTEGERDTVDFEGGVWVHRRRKLPHPLPPKAVEMKIPQHIWDFSATMLDVAAGIAEDRPIDAVFAPIWDCEGVAFKFDSRFSLATTLHTMLASYIDSHPHVRLDKSFMGDFAKPMLALEATMLNSSDAVVANSRAIIEQVEGQYGLQIPRERLHLVPHGMGDWLPLPRVAPPPLKPGITRLLFVGRLENRKGIDVLLAALEKIMPKRTDLHVDLVGNDRLEAGDGRTFRNAFEERNLKEPFIGRVRFHGEVTDEQLRGFYAEADIFVAPSRFESFGLIFLEAMMFAKPVVGCRAGGMPEVVDEGVTGLLVEPGDVDELAEAITCLQDDPALRERMGQAGRARYLAQFAPVKMAQGMLGVVDALGKNPRVTTVEVAA